MVGRGRLPLRIVPIDDESIVGFLVRLAERNHEVDVLAFAQAVGIPFSVLTAAATIPFDLVPLSEASLVPVPQLRALTYWGDTRRLLNFRGHSMSLSMVTLSRRLVCPACLGEGSYHRAAWDLSLAAACPRHALLLVSSCPDCGRRLRWTDPSIRRCSYGHDLARSSARLLPSPDVEGSLGFYRLLGLSDVPTLGGCPLPQAVHILGANAAMALIFHLGWCSSDRYGMPRPTAFRYHVEELPLILGLGYRAALNWPASFHEVLSRRINALSNCDGGNTNDDVRLAFKRLLSFKTARPIARILHAEAGRFVSMQPAFWQSGRRQPLSATRDPCQPDTELA